MPLMTEHESFDTFKGLLIGDSGAGKTGALAALVDAGFNLRILDFDNGLSPLRGFVRDKSKLSNVAYKTLRDNFKLIGSKVAITKAPSFQEAMDVLQNGFEGTDIKGVDTWGPRDWLIFDTLSGAGKASLNMVLALNGAGSKQPEIQHYGTAMDNISKMIDKLTSDDIKCNVLINTHITSTEGADGVARMYPEALGSKLPAKVGRSFDNMLGLQITAGERKFHTKRMGAIALKTGVSMAETYPIGTGLFDIWKAATGRSSVPEA